MRISKKDYEDLVAKGIIPSPPKPKSKVAQYKSKAEAQFAWELQDQLEAGKIEWWAYEPVTLVIADADGVRCRYTPDFLVLGWMPHEDDPGWTQAVYTFYEVKGFLRESARIRFLAAKERYPFWNFVMVRKKKGGGFETIMG